MAVASPTPHTADPADREWVIPLHGEQLDVSIKQVITGEVEISTVTRLRDESVDEELTTQTAHIERRAIGRVVDAAPDIREEDGVIIIPVMEEIIVVERRLVLKEEVRIRRSTSTHRHQETVTTRHQEAVVQRTPETASPDALPTKGHSTRTEEITP